LSDDQIQNAFDTFEGIKRRMEVRGEVEGVIIVDDFAHHPTAIKETLKALRMKYPTRRLWAIFEPRSNTTRRAVFQEELAKSFDGADQVVISAVAKVDQIPRSKRLDPLKLVNSIKASGVEGAYLRDIPAIVEHVRTHSQPGDVVCFLSNGSFGGIHEQLLEALKA
jgi:UDP-N-acetylmuramate: L-alanyl-gamma-D-glutamyl-meso-diaminopimelate ligase